MKEIERLIKEISEKLGADKTERVIKLIKNSLSVPSDELIIINWLNIINNNLWSKLIYLAKNLSQKKIVNIHLKFKALFTSLK
jgi:hypothetical protein